jgi:hypothetical protein
MAVTVSNSDLSFAQAALAYGGDAATYPPPQPANFVVTFGPQAVFGTVNDIVSAPSAPLNLTGIGNVVYGPAASFAVSVHGGAGLSTVVLGNGNDQVALQGAFNTIVLGDGNDVVNAGAATGTVVFQGGVAHVTYQNYLSATFAAPLNIAGIESANAHNMGAFNSGTGNIGAFNGWGNADASDGNYNIGVFNGNANGGTDNGNNNIGAFNGNFNGLGNSSPSDGANNGDGNIGVLDGNYNGDLNSGTNTGNGNGNGNVGIDSGNLNGNGAATVALLGAANSTTQLVGGFDTIVVGNGNDTITAMAGISTIVAGNGNDQISIGGYFNTVVAGNGADHVVGTNVDHSSITLGNGGNTVTLTGAGYNAVKTGSGNDIISLSGNGNWVDAGAAVTFNTIYGGANQDIFVLAAPGSGFDKIFNFTTSNGDQLDLHNVLAALHWDGNLADLGLFVTTTIVNGDTLLETSPAAAILQGIAPFKAAPVVIAELVGVNYTLFTLETHHSLLL